MTKAVSDVAIIGAGFTGTCLAIQLMQRMPAGARILMIGAADEIGQGLAYRATHHDLLLNVAAARMSLFPEDDGDFVGWLAERCEGKAALPHWMLGQLYVSRACYGRYLRDRLGRAIEQSRNRVTVELIAGRAVSLRPAGADYGIELADGDRRLASTVALCLGNAPGRLPLAAQAIAPGAEERIIADAWNDPRAAALPGDARVLLLGTGLTMVDQALRLERAGHGGRVTAISRHGLLPAEQRLAAVAPAELDLPERNAGLGEIFRAIVRAGRREQAAGGDWRSVLEALRPQSQELWQGLSLAERQRFLRHVETLWSVHRHRMAPAVAKRIAELRDAGRLSIRAARLVAVGGGRQGLRASLRARGSRLTETAGFDWIVNCAGPGRYAGLAADPLVAGLVEAGLARPDRLRLGLDVTADATLIAGTGLAVGRLFALGPLGRGRFLEITAVREIRAQAGETADRLAAEMLGQLFPKGRPRRRFLAA